MKTYILIILFFIFVYTSCTYERPLLSIRVSNKVFVDSITHGTKKNSIYKYLGLRKGMRLGGYSKMKQFDSLRNKILVRHWKKKPLYMCDGNVRFYTKIYYYTSSGKKEKITKHIVQHRGLGGYVAFDTTIYFENGKRIKSVNE